MAAELPEDNIASKDNICYGNHRNGIMSISAELPTKNITSKDNNYLLCSGS